MKATNFIKYQKIQAKIIANKEKMRTLLNQNIDLEYELNLLKATKIFTETRQRGTKKHPISSEVKIIQWQEQFVDEDNGKVVTIDRHRIIEVDGQKSDGWQIIKYY